MTPAARTEPSAADIAWMRQLAEEGGRAPMQGGSILMTAGLVYGLAGLVHWSVISGVAPVSNSALGFVWIGATVLFLAVMTIIILGLRKREGVVTAANRASSVVWSGVGWGIFALFASVAMFGLRVGGDAAIDILALTPSIIMVFYGMGWAVTAAMLKSRPLWGLAVASFVAAPLLAVLTGQAAQYLAYAAALFLLMALPGFVLMRQAGRA